VSDSAKAKLFQNGRSQAVRLPQQFRFRGNEVRARRVSTGVILEPILAPNEWFAELDQFEDEPFMQQGRNQPLSPIGKSF
jgi:antitoxin VapB